MCRCLGSVLWCGGNRGAIKDYWEIQGILMWKLVRYRLCLFKNWPGLLSHSVRISASFWPTIWSRRWRGYWLSISESPWSPNMLSKNGPRDCELPSSVSPDSICCRTILRIAERSFGSRRLGLCSLEMDNSRNSSAIALMECPSTSLRERLEANFQRRWERNVRECDTQRLLVLL